MTVDSNPSRFLPLYRLHVPLRHSWREEPAAQTIITVITTITIVTIVVIIMVLLLVFLLIIIMISPILSLIIIVLITIRLSGRRSLVKEGCAKL